MEDLQDLLEPLTKWEAEKIFEELQWEEWHRENDHTIPDYPPSVETSGSMRPKGRERRDEKDDSATNDTSRTIRPRDGKTLDRKTG
jgi:hypothetical protein